MNNSLPKFVYALFNDEGSRMTGRFGKIYFDRTAARSARQQANKKTKSTAIRRAVISTDWEPIR